MDNNSLKIHFNEIHAAVSHSRCFLQFTLILNSWEFKNKKISIKMKQGEAISLLNLLTPQSP